MNIVQRIIAELTSAMSGVPVRYGVIEQGPSDQPPSAPYVIVQRTGSLWELDTMCGSDFTLPQVDVQIDSYNTSAAAAMRSAALVRQVLGDIVKFPLIPSLEYEYEIYEPQSRLWRTIQTWRCWDDDPDLAEPSPLEPGDILLETGDPDAFLLEFDTDTSETIITEDVAP